MKATIRKKPHDPDLKKWAGDFQKVEVIIINEQFGLKNNHLYCSPEKFSLIKKAFLPKNTKIFMLTKIPWQLALATTNF